MAIYKAQRNFTDAESRIMPAPGGRDFIQGYNCQAVVDSAHQVIVAARADRAAGDTAAGGLPRTSERACFRAVMGTSGSDSSRISGFDKAARSIPTHARRSSRNSDTGLTPVTSR